MQIEEEVLIQVKRSSSSSMLILLEPKQYSITYPTRLLEYVEYVTKKIRKLKLNTLKNNYCIFNTSYI